MYPELIKNKEQIKNTSIEEQQKFMKTLEHELKIRFYNGYINYLKEKHLKAILVAVCTDGDDTSEDFIHMLEETQDLIEACEMDTVRWVTQNLQYPNPGTYLGSGKLAELSETVELFKADYVVVADNLSPAQLKNITDAVDAAVLDRTSLILEIFARRAKTREARLQVELANLQYMLPRCQRSYE